jgi:hypothetical protein
MAEPARQKVPPAEGNGFLADYRSVSREFWRSSAPARAPQGPRRASGCHPPEDRTLFVGTRSKAVVAEPSGLSAPVSQANLGGGVGLRAPERTRQRLRALMDGRLGTRRLVRQRRHVRKQRI